MITVYSVEYIMCDKSILCGMEYIIYDKSLLCGVYYIR